MYYTYVMKSIKNDNLYFGYTNDLKKRISQHNKGTEKSTAPYIPWELIYYEACINKADAQRREKYFKTSQGRRMFRLRIKEYFYSLNRVSS